MKKKDKRKERQPLEVPTIEQLEKELGREKYRSRFRRVMRNTIYALITVAAAAVLAAAVFTENWIFYLLIACIVFAVSIMGSRGKRRE